MPTSPDTTFQWWAIVTPVVSFLAGSATAVFAEPLRRWIYRPKLRLEFNETEHFITKTIETSASDSNKSHQARYIRVKVTNTRLTLAKSCRAYLINVERRDPSGVWAATEFCESIQLAWSARNKDIRYASLDLAKDVPHFVDVVSTREGTPPFKLEVESKLLRHEPLLRTPGIYRLTMVVSGDGVRPERLWLFFQWDGKWDGFVVRRSER